MYKAGRRERKKARCCNSNLNSRVSAPRLRGFVLETLCDPDLDHGLPSHAELPAGDGAQKTVRANP